MRKHSLCLAAAAILSLATSLVSQAANYPTDPYDATYAKQKMLKKIVDGAEKYVNEGGVSDYRFVTDGAGHIRIETEPANSGLISGVKPAKNVTIFDFQNGESFILLEKQKIAMRSPLKNNATLAPIDAKRIKELNGKSLGTNYGQTTHPCHGWEYTLNGVKTETWVADDLRCPFDTYILNVDGSLDFLHLVKYTNHMPSPDEFNIPRDFKQTGPNGAG